MPLHSAICPHLDPCWYIHRLGYPPRVALDCQPNLSHIVRGSVGVCLVARRGHPGLLARACRPKTTRQWLKLKIQQARGGQGRRIPPVLGPCGVRMGPGTAWIMNSRIRDAKCPGKPQRLRTVTHKVPCKKIYHCDTMARTRARTDGKHARTHPCTHCRSSRRACLDIAVML